MTHKKTVLLQVGQETRLGNSLLLLKNPKRDEEGLSVTLLLYDFDLETRQEIRLTKGSELEISHLPYRVRSLETREAEDTRSFSERFLLELERI